MEKVSDRSPQNVTWFQYNNIVSIVVSAVMVAGTFWSLKTDVRVLIERVDNLISAINKQDNQITQLQDKDVSFATKIQELDTRTEVLKNK